MLDLMFAVAFVALPILALVITRGSAAFSVLMAVTVGVSGVLMQFLALTVQPFTFRGLQVWLTATLLILVGLAAWTRRRDLAPVSRSALLVGVGSSVVVAAAFATSRLLAPGQPGPLTGVGWLIERKSAEDNAKWLNTTAELASGVPVESSAAVGGPLLLVLVFAATMIGLASTLLYGGINEVAVASGTLILSEMLMAVVAAFALAPIVQARIRWTAGPGRRQRSTIPWPLGLLSVGILVTAVTLLLNYGHLTLQYTLLSLALWVSVFLAPVRGIAARTLATFAVVTTAEVWFPLNVLALGAVLALTALGAWGLLKGRPERRKFHAATAAGGVIVLILMFDFLRSSIQYALGTGGSSRRGTGSRCGRGVAAIDVPALPLFAQPGGTETVTRSCALLTVISVMAAVAFRRSRVAHSTAPSCRSLPIIALVRYAALVTLADFWAIGSGPNYASKKILFAITIPILAATAPLAILALGARDRRMTMLRWFAVAAVAMLLIFDTFVPRAIVQLKPNLWPTTQADPQPYWWPAEVRPTADQPCPPTRSAASSFRRARPNRASSRTDPVPTRARESSAGSRDRTWRQRVW